MSDDQPDESTEEVSSEQLDALAGLPHSSATWKVLGELPDTDGIGVLGHATASSGTTRGVVGVVDSTTDGAAGLRGEATGASGQIYGVFGTTASDAGYGVYTPDDVGVGGRLDATTVDATTVEADRVVVTHTLPPYDEVGTDPQRAIDALDMLFSEPAWADARYRSGPSHGEGTNAFSGAALAPTGEVVFAPVDSSNVGVVDTNAQTHKPRVTALHPLVNTS